MRNRSQKGFTLMELMVVIVIVAILAAVAVPLYVNYVKDARRTEAKGAIGAVITAEQQYFQQHGTYVPDVMTSGAVGQSLNCDVTEALANWTIVVSAADQQGYTVTATGLANKDTNGLTEVYTFTRTAGGTFNP